ncbi:MAG: UvrB/UvrC motif-containing protein [Bacteroidetes bacterium]|nr:UvrB/UvrC motif-containing protein [Bacteroidota bacterium]
MSAKAKNLNFLKRCGYLTNYHTNGNEIMITCRSDIGLPELVIILTCSIWESSFGKSYVNDLFLIEKAEIINLETNISQKFDTKGRVIPTNDGEYYLEPRKEIIDFILPMVDKQGVYKHLWKLSQEILSHEEESINKQKAIEIFENIPDVSIIEGEIIHPFIFNGRKNQLSFISREILEYCLAYELNKKKDSSRILRKFITRFTLDFLDYDQSLFKDIFPKITDLKHELVRNQQYEKAAFLRDLELDFPAEYMSGVWPNLSKSEVQTFFTSRLLGLDLE